ncbi:MAG: long-chain fatty acid--CoA ligase [Ardenticatenaceae bacterium]|nr:long-chain fatty acid--CoA ligase [Anaerolineales bacterium]MCB8923577.1 long-chain fatty acid--CoA ligase [Ardenticatenaceae bacterium]MCB9003517.1 long-chain fatty acid--CoA ligase [Ardenticatenaceae bacterium]
MAETFPQLLIERTAEFGERQALREKDYGIWQAISWNEYLRHVRFFSQGLVSLGLTPEDTVAIIGDNRPEWIYSELAAQAAGAKSIGIYQDAVVKEMIYIITHARVKFIVVEDQEQVDKILEMWDELTGVEKVIYYDPKGLRNYTEEFLMFFPDVEKLGEAFEQENPGWFEESVQRGKADDIAILSTTSGTTGNPKLAMITHKNLVSMGHNLMELDPLLPDDRFVSFLPMAWIGEQMLSFACSLQNGFTLNFPEEPETALANVREIGPHSMFSPPRIWENLVSQVLVKIEDSSRLKKAVYDWAMQIGYEMADYRFRKEEANAAMKFKYFLADWLVFQEIKDHLGLRHLKRAYTGGAALGPDVFRFFHALGVNLKQIYGQTEASGISVVHRDGDIKFQTVGTPVPGTAVRIAENGEILLKSDSIFKGYYRNPEATAETLIDGWMHSGDAGYFDEDGHLIVIDRAKDVMTLHDGTKFSPQFIENKLKFSPYVKEAVVFGGDWPFVTAMINIDMENTGKWAENNQIAYTTYTDLAQKPEVYALVRKQVETANSDLPDAARIQRFLLLHKELDADDAELTRTRKVRRRFVAQRYDDIISALYSQNDHLDVETTITYQDGRTATLNTRLRIESLNGSDQ